MMQGMTPRRLLVAALLAALALVPSAAHAQSAQSLGTRLIDFEEFVGASSEGCGGNTIGSYAGFSWSGIGWASALECGQADPPFGPPNGYAFGSRPGGARVGYVMVPAGADPFSAPATGGFNAATRFNFLDGWITAAWEKDLHLLVRGFRNGTLVHTRALLLQYDQPLFVNFAFDDVDAVTFEASGGTIDFNLGGLGAEVVLDDLRVSDVSPVPEPATLALLVPGLALVAAAARRRR
jgi:hypothetical protein